MDNRLGVLAGAGERQNDDATGAEAWTDRGSEVWDGFWGVNPWTVLLLVLYGALGQRKHSSSAVKTSVPMQRWCLPHLSAPGVSVLRIPAVPKALGSCACSVGTPTRGSWAQPSGTGCMGNVTALVFVPGNGSSQGKLPFCSSCSKMDFLWKAEERQMREILLPSHCEMYNPP